LATSELTPICYIIYQVCLFGVLHLCEAYELYGVDMDASPDSLSGYARSMYQRQHHRRISVPDSAFQPNLMNSAIYILSVVIQTNNFVVNYRGEPFTQNLVDNKKLLRSVQFIYFVIFVVLSDVFEPLNDLLELEKFPCYEFQYLLGIILVANFAACWYVEKFCQKYDRGS
jgi:magnesium-transporting ATPase (P-type)